MNRKYTVTLELEYEPETAAAERFDHPPKPDDIAKDIQLVLVGALISRGLSEWFIKDVKIVGISRTREKNR